MRAYLLNSGKTLEGYWGKIWTKPKCLLPINDATIIDYQIDRFKKLFIPITVIVGYGAKEVVQHCESRRLGVSYITDYGWNKEYSLRRTLLEVGSEILAHREEIILVHGDLLFNIDLLREMVNAIGDVVLVQGKNMIYRFTQSAFSFALESLAKAPDYEAVNAPLWRVLKEKFRVTELNPYIWHEDIDRPEVYNKYKKTGVLDEISNDH